MKTIVISIMLMLVLILPAMAFQSEIGTYYGMSVIFPYGDDATSIITSQVPSGTIDLGTGLASLYTMFFFGNHFATGLELSNGIFSVFDNSSDGPIFSLGSFSYAGQAAFYLRDYSRNSPYLLGRISRTSLRVSDFSFYSDDYDITSLGTGIGYQHHIKSNFVLRTELRYHRMFSTPKRDYSNVFSWVIGLGIR